MCIAVTRAAVVAHCEDRDILRAATVLFSCARIVQRTAGHSMLITNPLRGLSIEKPHARRTGFGRLPEEEDPCLSI